MTTSSFLAVPNCTASMTATGRKEEWAISRSSRTSSLVGTRLLHDLILFSLAKRKFIVAGINYMRKYKLYNGRKNIIVGINM